MILIISRKFFLALTNVLFQRDSDASFQMSLALLVMFIAYVLQGKLSTIKYFSLHSVNVQCEVFALTLTCHRLRLASALQTVHVRG